MTNLLFILSVVLASPNLKIGGEVGFREHLKGLEAAFAVSPNGQDAYRIATGYASRGEIVATRKWLFEAKKLGIDAHRLEICLADALRVSGDAEGALRAYFEVLTRLPDHYGALRGLWMTRLHATQISELIDLTRVDTLLEEAGFPVVRLNRDFAPKKAQKHLYRAKLALRKGALERAEVDLRIAIQQHWSTPEAYRLLSELWKLRDEPRKRHGTLSIFLEFATKPNQLYRKALRTWMDTERRGRLTQ